MPGVVGIFGSLRVQRIGFLDVPPAILSPVDPVVARDFSFRVNWCGIFARHQKLDEVVAHRAPGLHSISFQSGKLERARFGADSLCLWVATNQPVIIVDEPSSLSDTD